MSDVKDRIEHARQRVGAASAAVRLVAVSKKFPAELVAAAAAAGQHDFGENYVAELSGKAAELNTLGLNWHVIGPVQRRAVTRLPEQLSLIHTLDRIELLERFDRTRPSPWPPFLIQVNVGADPDKSGLAPDAVAPFVEQVAERFAAARIEGLMTIPPLAGDSRPHFAALRELGEQLCSQSLLPRSFELSMGMSDDYEAAIAEGATIVRVGSAIFGPRPSPR